MIKLINTVSVLGGLGFKKSSLYNKQKEGTFPSPLQNTGTHNLWPDYEIIQIQNAYIQGKSASQMKALVKRILKERELGIAQ